MWSKRNDLVDYKIPEQRLNISFIFSPNLYRHPRGIETMNPLVFMIVRSAPAPPPPPLPGPIAAAIIEALTSVVLAISRGVDTTFGLPQLKVPLTIDPAAQDGVVASNSLLSTAWNVVSEHFSPSLISNQPRYMVAVNSNEFVHQDVVFVIPALWVLMALFTVIIFVLAVSKFKPTNDQTTIQVSFKIPSTSVHSVENIIRFVANELDQVSADAQVLDEPNDVTLRVVPHVSAEDPSEPEEPVAETSEATGDPMDEASDVTVNATQDQPFDTFHQHLGDLATPFTYELESPGDDDTEFVYSIQEACSQENIEDSELDENLSNEGAIFTADRVVPQLIIVINAERLFTEETAPTVNSTPNNDISSASPNDDVPESIELSEASFTTRSSFEEDDSQSPSNPFTDSVNAEGGKQTTFSWADEVEYTSHPSLDTSHSAEPFSATIQVDEVENAPSETLDSGNDVYASSHTPTPTFDSGRLTPASPRLSWALATEGDTANPSPRPDWTQEDGSCTPFATSDFEETKPSSSPQPNWALATEDSDDYSSPADKSSLSSPRPNWALATEDSSNSGKAKSSPRPNWALATDSDSSRIPLRRSSAPNWALATDESNAHEGSTNASTSPATTPRRRHTPIPNEFQTDVKTHFLNRKAKRFNKEQREKWGVRLAAQAQILSQNQTLNQMGFGRCQG